MIAAYSRVLAAVIFYLCLLAGECFAARKVQPAVNVELLPYLFRTQRTVQLLADGECLPMRHANQEHMGAYELGNHRRDDTLSYIIFRPDFNPGAAIRQANRNIWTFWSTKAADLDYDGDDEIAATYAIGAEAWFEIIDVDNEISYKRMLFTCIDHNGNGRFETSFRNINASDINGDGYAECFMSVFSAFDLYPRAFYCLDWKNDSVLWVQDVTGLLEKPVLTVNAAGAPRIVLCVSSMGNAVTADTMTDRNSYLLCLDDRGTLLWSKTRGGIFSWTWALPIDSDDDGVMEILSWTKPGPEDDSGQSGGYMQIYDLNGTPGKSLQLPEKLLFRSVITGDLDGDGRDEVIASTSDRMVTVYDGQLNQLNQYEFPTEIRFWKCADFLGKGNNQLLAVTDDGVTLLLSGSLRLRAQMNAEFDLGHSGFFEADFAKPGKALVLKDQEENRVHLIYFERQPFLTRGFALMARNQSTLYASFAALILALVFTNYHRRKVRRNLGVISSQRDKLEQTGQELEETLKDLKAAQTKLVQSEKMASLGKLVAGIAHEINSPLAAITSSNNTAARAISLLRKQVGLAKLDEQTEAGLMKAVEALENSNLAVDTGAQKVDHIVSKLRSFARLDEAELQKVNLSECLEETLELLRPQLKQRVIVNKEYGELPAIPCYPGYLNQVFLNVLMNAVEAIRERGEITVKAFSENETAVIQVIDTGVGISSDRLDNIFDPGYTTKGHGIGTGLGLSIAYQIVCDHKGQITVDSEVGRGTTVTIRLPIDL
ncbi:MAG: hypothetical protein JSV52_07950 [Candidatus Zixiibacteriota bacterium]|nr:MAG: hypothetical protein JSV52_07950 [candidate division Zixibacteria bacterium]